MRTIQTYRDFFLLAIVSLILLSSAPTEAREAPIAYPVPKTVSSELQALISPTPLVKHWNAHPKNAAEWRELVNKVAASAGPRIAAFREQLAVQSTPGSLGGVPIYTLRPKAVAQAHQDRVLLHIHGGGYVFYPGDTGTEEGIFMAALGKIVVVSVDYRMPPDHPYPAALDDVLAVYRALLKRYPPERIGVFGSSTGGGLTLALVLRAKAEGLPLPAAIAPGSPWSDLDKVGDSYFTHAGQDNVLVTYDGWLGDAARLYANGHDLRDPYLSPVYGDVTGFPPVFLTSGTRDLFLSNTVRMHLKLRAAGVPAELMVFEGMSHVHYLADPAVPEVRQLFAELTGFFDRNMR
ncbi:MAG: alpha/beta hydrolase [Desulfovibrionaceae bacterium]|nr:alpha/beta hydrolase [Desulfovibrionaceae bacterium]